MGAIEDLIGEHQAVLTGLDLLTQVAGALEAGKPEAPSQLNELLEFFTGFVDQCHHAKEEEVLFPVLQKLGGKDPNGSIGVLLTEHETGRNHLRSIREQLQKQQNGDVTAAASIRRHASAYGALLKTHIDNENYALFPLAQRLIPAQEAQEMADAFATIEQQRIGQGKHEAYHAMLHRLKALYPN